jgi:excisionase family DNA binding protein
MLDNQSGQSSLTVSEASDLKMIEPSLILRAIKTGRLPAVEEAYGKRKRYRIDSDDLERWVEWRKG